MIYALSNRHPTFFYYNTRLNDQTFNKSLNSTFINTQETLDRTTKLAQQDIQTPLHFVNEEIVETIAATTQRNSLPVHPTTTTSQEKQPSVSTNNTTTNN